jgi:hypothetical protein
MVTERASTLFSLHVPFRQAIRSLSALCKYKLISHDILGEGPPPFRPISVQFVAPWHELMAAKREEVLAMNRGNFFIFVPVKLIAQLFRSFDFCL